MLRADLPGEQLVFVFIAACVVLLVLHCAVGVTVRYLPPRRPVRLTELASNPYRVAYLRGGMRQMFRVAVINLVDRGLLRVSGSAVRRLKDETADYARQLLDKAILDAAPALKEPRELEDVPRIAKVADEFEEELAGKGLLLSERRRRVLQASLGTMAAAIAAFVLAALGLGQHIAAGAMVLIAILVLWPAYIVTRNHATVAGLRAIDSLRTLAETTRRRLNLGLRSPASSEVALCAALFGIYALPRHAFPYVDQLFPGRRQRRGRSDDGWDTFDWGDGCGSGCGGCGGGCGGCGS